MLAKALQQAAGNAAQPLYVDDVFSTYLYTGNGSTQTITNGIDLAGEGGLVWHKSRSKILSHQLYDTARGVGKYLISNTTNAENTSTYLTAFNSDGFTLGYPGGTGGVNENGTTYASWTFRKAPKFFDVVTYTGNGTNRTIAHSLGQEPGMIVIKRTDSAADWQVYHRSLANTQYLVLNSTAAAATGATRWNSTTATSSVFSLGTDTTVNASGGTYVAYLFAHDTDPDGFIQCGSFTGPNKVTLNFEPQFVIFKAASSAGAWYMMDTMRGVFADVSNNNDPVLLANSSGSEFTGQGYIGIDATGFTPSSAAVGPSDTYIYLAIRRPNKPPTSGTEVYNAIARTGTGAAATVTGVGFAPDLVIGANRNMPANGVTSIGFVDKLRGTTPWLGSAVTAAENTFNTDHITGFLNNGYSVGADINRKTYNPTGESLVAWNFRRAPGFFDVVCYTGDNTSNRAVAHSLGAQPEIIIFKSRSSATNWLVAANLTSTTLDSLQLNSTNLATTNNYATTTYVRSLPTISEIRVNAAGGTNGVSTNYVAYLFASLPGISKVGSYTGNGSSQTINCGFSTGARFVLIKRTDSTGDWYVWDTARGIVAANDPHLSLNSTAAEVTTNDSIDPDSSGFIVNQVAATNINVSSASYIYLAIA